VVNSTAYIPSDVLDLAASSADRLQLEAFLDSLSPTDDVEYTTDAATYVAAWPALWKGFKLDYFNYSLS